MQRKITRTPIDLIAYTSMILLSITWVIISLADCYEQSGGSQTKKAGFFTWFVIVLIAIDIIYLLHTRLVYIILSGIGWLYFVVAMALYAKLCNLILGNIYYFRAPDYGGAYYSKVTMLPRGRWCIFIGFAILFVHLYLICKTCIERIKKRKCDRRNDS